MENFRQCAAPTSISLNKTIVKPGELVTLSWSGAKKGIPEADSLGKKGTIKGYQIWINQFTSTGNEIFSSLAIINTSSTSGSYSFTLSSHTRGQVVRVAIKTLAEDPLWDSPVSSKKLVAQCNILPKINTLSVSQTIIPSNQTEIQTKVTLGGTDEDGQNIKYYYGTSSTFNTNNLTLVTNGSIIKVKKGTYYFFPYDGLEPGAYKSITFTQNTAPKITNHEIEGILDSSKNTTYPFAKKLSFSFESNKNSNIVYNLEYKHAPSIAELAGATWSKISTTSSEIELDFASKGIPKGNYFSVQAYLTEKLGNENEDSTIISLGNYRLPNTFSKDNFRIELIQGLTSGYQDGNGADIIASSGYFKNLLSFNTNTTVNSINNSTNHSDKSSITKFSIYWGKTVDTITNLLYTSKSTDFNKTIFTDISFTQTYNSDQVIYFSIKFEDAFYSYTNSLTKYLIYSAGPKFVSNSTATFTNYVKPYSYGATALSFTKENNIWDSETSPSSNFSQRYKFELMLSSNNKTINYDISEFASLNASTTDTTVLVNFGEGLLDKIIEMAYVNGIDTNSTYKNAYIKITAYNYFDQIATLSSSNFELDFREPCAIDSVLLNIGSKNTNSFTIVNSIENIDYLKESMSLFLNTTIKSYNGAPRVQVQISKDDAPYENFGETISCQESGTQSGHETPINYKLENGFIETFKQITQDYKANFRLIVSNETNLTTTYEYIVSKTIWVKRHTNGSVLINSAEIIENDNKVLQILYDIQDIGIDANLLGTSFEVKLQKKEIDEDSFADVDPQPTIDFLTGRIEYSADDWPTAAYVRLEVTVSNYYNKANNQFFSTYTFTSDEKIAYNILPTLSHRKNHVGINCMPEKRTETDGVLFISEYDVYKKIYLVSPTGLRSIDLSSGHLNGFIIDGGSWDD